MAMIWGTSFILMKKSLEVYDISEVAAGRLFFAFLFFLPFIFRSASQVKKVRYKYLIISGLTGFLLPAFLYAIAGTRLNSSLSGTLNSMSPLFTLLIGGFFFGMVIQTRQFLGILMGLFGSLLLVFSSATGELNFFDPYALLVILATLMYGININVISRYLSDLPAIVSTSWTFAFLGPACFIVLLTTGFFGKLVDMQYLTHTIFLIALGLGASAIASIMFNRVVQLSSPLFSASVTYIMPIIAMMWGLFDGEKIVLQQYLGMAVILFGVYLVNRSKEKPTKEVEG